MTDSRLPELFGRATAVQNDHRELRELVGRLRVACEALARPEDTAQGFIELLDEFADRVLSHFRSEEGANYFGVVATDRPALREQIVKLEIEHDGMRTAIARVRLLTADAGRRQSAADELARLLDALEAHERAESALIREFLAPTTDPRPES